MREEATLLGIVTKFKKGLLEVGRLVGKKEMQSEDVILGDCESFIIRATMRRARRECFVWNGGNKKIDGERLKILQDAINQSGIDWESDNFVILHTT